LDISFENEKTKRYLLDHSLQEEENGGEPGIRTPGGLLTHAGFQDQSIQPLWQLTAIAFLSKAGCILPIYFYVSTIYF
jgi:hypothetical protein